MRQCPLLDVKARRGFTPVMTLTPKDLAILDSVDPALMLDQTMRWSAINSGSRNLDGLAQMAGELTQAFAALPGDLHLLDAAEDRIAGSASGPLGQNIHIKVRPDAPVQIVLTGHMDTVFGMDHPFQSVSGVDERGVVNGPGVADMKGGIAVMLAALTAFERAPVAAQMGYEVILNSDEEIGSGGSGPLIAQAAQGKRAALTYEPAQTPEGMFASSRAGSGNFEIHVAGKSAHAGRNPQDGRNAVVAASDLALRLSAARRDGLSINPARITGGSPNNVVPDTASLHFNMRPRSPQDEAQALAVIEAAMAAVRVNHDVALHLHGGFTRPPKPLTPALQSLFDLVRRCGSALGQPVDWQPSGGVCDGNNIAACGVPVIDTMGVRGGAIHSPDEFLIVESLAERARLSTLVLMRLAAGE